MKHNQQLKYSTILIIFIITGLLLTACGGVQTQDKIFTIGVACEFYHLDEILDSFKAEMIQLGYVEGKDVTYIYHGELGTELQKSEAAIKSLMDQEIDLLLTLGTPPAKAAKKVVEGTNLPVVFVPIVNPVEERLVASIAHPGGNLTGIQNVNIAPKALEWLLKTAPDTKQVYTPYYATDQIALTSIEPLPDAATQLGVTLTLDEVSSGDEVMAAIKALPEDSAIFFPPSPGLYSNLSDMRKLAIELGIPTGTRDPGATDVVVTYTTDAVALGKQTAVLADKILKGAKPADLPVETSEFFLTINLKTAEAIGLDISDDILRQADTVIR
jgi:putative ABC transport system substrate-binding protein